MTTESDLHCDSNADNHRHGVSWDDWDRQDPTEGPWQCCWCGALVTLSERRTQGFALWMYIIPEEKDPW